MAAACAHGPAKGGRGASAAASASAAGFWLSNGATSSSESNCNYVYIVADDDGDGDVRRFISSVVAVALTTEERRAAAQCFDHEQLEWELDNQGGSVLCAVSGRGPHAHACLEIILNYKIAIKQDRHHMDQYEAPTLPSQARTCVEFGGTN